MTGDRPYQIDAVSAALSHLENVRSTLLVMATGLGKTRVFCRLAEGFPGRVLILAHRDELITQAAAAVERLTGRPADIEQGPLRAQYSRIVVGSVQTLCRERRLTRYKRDEFDLIIIDEAHRSPAKSYQRILDHFEKAKVLGVTATPDRTDGQAMGRVFESVCYEMGIQEGVSEGWLCPIVGETVIMEDCNLDLIPARAGDLATDILDAEILKQAEFAAAEMLKRDTGSTIVFTPGVRSARYLSERLSVLTGGSSVCVDGSQPEDERKAAVERYRSGDARFLVNCMVATEGFDAPSTRTVAILRPTKSRSLYTQMVGRGTRTEPGALDGLETAAARRTAIGASGKPACHVLDFVGVGHHHRLIGPADVLGGSYSEEEKLVAKKVLSEGQRDVNDALKEARERLRSAIEQVRGVQYTSRLSNFNPFDALGLEPIQSGRVEPLSPKQRGYLASKGFRDVDLDKMSRTSASKAITTLIKRDQKGGATLKQLAFLGSMGVNDPRMGRNQASWVITELQRIPPTLRSPDAIRMILAMSKRKAA